MLDSAQGVTEHDWPQVLPGGKRALVQIWHNSIADTELAVVDLATGESTPIMQGIYGRYIPTGHIVYATFTGSLMRVPFDPSARQVTGAPLAIAEGVQIDGNSGSAQFSVSDNGTLALHAGRRRRGRTGGLGRSQRETDPGGHGVARPVLRCRPVARQFAPRCRRARKRWRTDVGEAAPDRPALPRVLQARRHQTDRCGQPTDAVSRSSPHRPAGCARAGSSASTAVPRPRCCSRPDGAWRVSLDAGREALLVRLGSTRAHATSCSPPKATPPSASWCPARSTSSAPAVSPDGRWFVYVTSESGRNEIFVRRLDDPGAGRTQVSRTGGEEPRWAHNGRELFFRTRARRDAGRRT